MQIWKKMFVGFSVVTVMFSTAAYWAQADGMIIPPPSRRMFETDQKAVIFHDEGTEHLVLSITFRGDAGDFAWIVPTPAKPEVEKSIDLLFTRLDELTRPEYPMPERDLTPMIGALDATNEKGVTVLETKQIEYYDISVLDASDSQALYNWLNDNGYRFPLSGTQMVEEYIQKGWVFTAVKISNDLEGLAQGQINAGHAVPLKLSFATDQIVYPLKISSLNGMEDDAPEGQISFVEGSVGKAAKLDSDRILATDKVVKKYDPANSMVSFDLKKRDSDPVHKIVSVKATNANGGEYDTFMITNNRANVFQITINKTFYEQYQVDLGSDFKQNQWQHYDIKWEQNAAGTGYEVTFAIDGVTRTVNKVMSSRNYANEGTDLRRVVLGGNYIEAYAQNQGRSSAPGTSMPEEMYITPNIYIDRSGDLLIDNLVINSNLENVLQANFDDNLNVLLAGDEPSTLRVFSKSSNYPGSTMPADAMGVLLYIFSEKKYDVPGFDLEYAGWMEKADIENIARIDGKAPWLTPAKDRYFLTRHYKYMATAEMTDDLYPTESEDQSSFNFAGSESAKITWVLILVGLSVVSLGAMVWLVSRSERKMKLPVKATPHELAKTSDRDN